MTARIEHVNVTVSDPDRTAWLLEALFGWRERWRGKSVSGGNTVHVGSDAQYVAVSAHPAVPPPPGGFAKSLPLNHIGVEVDDLAATQAKVIAAGLTPFNHGDYEPGRRFYFFDPDGIEYEVVSYV